MTFLNFNNILIIIFFEIEFNVSDGLMMVKVSNLCQMMRWQECLLTEVGSRGVCLKICTCSHVSIVLLFIYGMWCMSA